MFKVKTNNEWTVHLYTHGLGQISWSISTIVNRFVCYRNYINKFFAFASGSTLQQKDFNIYSISFLSDTPYTLNMKTFLLKKRDISEVAWYMYMCTQKLQMIKLCIFVFNCTRKTVVGDNVVLYFIPQNYFHNYFTSIIS